ncbi:hypothetical protein pEpSNUABM08_41 [Erwinia phage pEp_SNUABM_08]|uniref:Uncharacterized protein n=1 Tax=Erwinia phage pEp_SNUABM_08 TaxID=2593268 RepID=A0A5J6DAE7_9CAUD|nr:hypothetical protein JT353_gp41 [Erwinia phage pEp_SNUABM_08]QEQ94788.1 hypothetical protein pEpSNUABM08_41 [Erwinia phage pEp_SNUABM_08]
MTLHYVNLNGVKGMAMGGLLVDLHDVVAVGGYWPASDKDSAYFDIMLEDQRSIRATFDASVPAARHLEEHAKLVKALMKLQGEDMEFEPQEKTIYDTTDPDGAWLMTGRAIGAFVAYLYQLDDPDHLSGKEEAIKLAEEFAIKAFGDSMAMDEFVDARENAIWNPAEDDPDRVVSRGFGKPL